MGDEGPLHVNHDSISLPVSGEPKRNPRFSSLTTRVGCWIRYCSLGILGACLLDGCGVLRAQEYRYRSEIFGTLGYGRASDDEGSLGSGLNGGGGFGFRVSPKFGLELDVNGFRHERKTSPGLLFRGSGVFVTGNALYHFGSGLGRAQPYVVVGAGVLHKRNTSSFDESPPLDVSGRGFAMNAGTGVKIFVNRRFSLRPEFRFFWGGAGGLPVVESPFSILRASLGVAYHR